MVANDLNSFDAFLDNVTRMHDAITQFAISVDGAYVPNQDKFDSDFANLKELNDFTISDDSDENTELGSDSDNEHIESDVESSSGNSDVLLWLKNKCDSINSGSMSSNDLYSTVLGIITSGSPDEDLQISLPEIVGYENLDFVIDLIPKRTSIIAAQVSTRYMDKIIILTKFVEAK